MKLTPKMMGHLYRDFDKNPRTYPALSLNYQDATMEWTVADQVLTTVCTSTPADNLTLDLTAYDIQGLIAALAANPNYTVVSLAPDSSIGAIALMDGSGTPGNGIDQDILPAFSDLTWMTMDAAAHEVQDARNTLGDVLTELRLDLADGEWLELWMSYIIGGLKKEGETDAQLFQRIRSTVTLVKCNNVALEKIVFAQTGLTVQVVDINWFVANETLFTYGGPYWDPSMVTNSANARLYPAWRADPAVVAEFGLLPAADGVPAFGDPRNGNALLCAFAVIFSAPPACADYKTVMAAINKFKAGGTIGLAYQPSNTLLTNTLGDNTNDPAELSGPIGTLYAQYSC